MKKPDKKYLTTDVGFYRCQQQKQNKFLFEAAVKLITVWR